MGSLSEKQLYVRFPWAKPVVPDMDEELGFFYEPKPWEFNQQQLELIEKMFLEIEEFFKSKNMDIKVAIYEIREVFGVIRVDMMSESIEISAIVHKYEEMSKLINTDD